jgi:hypothetical protein
MLARDELKAAVAELRKGNKDLGQFKATDAASWVGKSLEMASQVVFLVEGRRRVGSQTRGDADALAEAASTVTAALRLLSLSGSPNASTVVPRLPPTTFKGLQLKPARSVQLLRAALQPRLAKVANFKRTLASIDGALSKVRLTWLRHFVGPSR